MHVLKPLGVSVPSKRWVYHITPKSNLDSIRRQGLVPNPNGSRFGAMSPELIGTRKLPKIFLLVSLTNGALRGFIEEWWYDDPLLLKIPFDNVRDPRQSADPYYARHEIWTYYTVPINGAYVSRTVKPVKWEPI